VIKGGLGERFEGFFSIDATLSLASKSAVANAKASFLLLKSVLSFSRPSTIPSGTLSGRKGKGNYRPYL
jgi:hypothetical protein